MRVTRVHVDGTLAIGDTIALPETAATHLLRVLRLQPGDSCVLFNGDGHDYDARISAIGKRDTQVEVLGARKPGNESALRIILLQALARGDKMDWILQKATELGIAAVVPVTSERSEVRLGNDRVDKRVAHWRNVVVAACEQSGRATVPPVSNPATFGQALPGLPASTRLLLDPHAAVGARDVDVGGSVDPIVLAIGPEGGWSPRDRESLHAAGFVGIRLGPRVLRTETAGIAAIAMLQSRFGDLG